MAADAKITQSGTYWRGEAAPVSIQEHAFSSGTGQLVLLNNDALGTVTVKSIILVDPSTGNQMFNPPSLGTLAPATVVLTSGAQKTVTLTGGNLPTGMTSQDVYQYIVQINYTSPDGLAKTETGAQPIIGKYSS